MLCVGELSVLGLHPQTLACCTQTTEWLPPPLPLMHTFFPPPTSPQIADGSPSPLPPPPLSSPQIADGSWYETEGRHVRVLQFFEILGHFLGPWARILTLFISIITLIGVLMTQVGGGYLELEP